MATAEEEVSSKHDDFFDDAPAPKPVENGHVSPEQKEKPEEKPEAANGTDGSPGHHEDATAAEEPVADAGTGASGDEPDQQGVEGEGDVKTDAGEANVGVSTTAEDTGEKAEAQYVEAEPEIGQTTGTPTPAPAEENGHQQEAQVMNGDAEGLHGRPGSAPTVTVEPPAHDEAAPPPASRQSEYDEDFSGSDITSARQTPAESKPEPSEDVEKEAKVKDKDSSSSSSSPDSSKASTPVIPAEPADTHHGGGAAGDEPQSTHEDAAPSPSPVVVVDPADHDEVTPSSGGQDGVAPPGDQEGGERADSRAEAGQVIPVPPPEVQTKPGDADGRSSSAGMDDAREGDAYRGEDRTELTAPEGSEDCRGQGQWKSPEQQAIATAMLASKSEREITEEAVKERDTLRQDHDGLKTQILSLESELDKRNEQILVDKEIIARKDKEMDELKRELDASNSQAASGEADESRQKDRLVIKDLQERLAVLARENEEKDKRVFRLEQELREAQTKLRDTERRLAQAEARADSEPPKSKTCVVM